MQPSADLAERDHVRGTLNRAIEAISQDEVILETLADGVTKLLASSPPRQQQAQLRQPGGVEQPGNARGSPPGGRARVVQHLIDKVFTSDSIVQLVGAHITKELKDKKKPLPQPPSRAAPLDEPATKRASAPGRGGGEVQQQQQQQQQEAPMASSVPGQRVIKEEGGGAGSGGEPVTAAGHLDAHVDHVAPTIKAEAAPLPKAEEGRGGGRGEAEAVTAHTGTAAAASQEPDRHDGGSTGQGEVAREGEEEEEDDAATISSASFVADDHDDDEEDFDDEQGEERQGARLKGFDIGELAKPGGAGFSSRAMRQQQQQGADASLPAAVVRRRPLLSAEDRSDSLVELDDDDHRGPQQQASSMDGAEAGDEASLGGSMRSLGSSRESDAEDALNTSGGGGGERRGARRRGGGETHHRRCTSSISSVLTVDSLQDLVMDLLPPQPHDDQHPSPHGGRGFRPVLATLHSMEPTDDDDEQEQEGGAKERAKRGSLLGRGGEDGEGQQAFFEAEEEEEGDAIQEVEDEYEDDYDEDEEEEGEGGQQQQEEQPAPSPMPWDRVPTKVRFVGRVVTSVHYIEPYANEDLPLLFYSEREIRRFEMEAEGPLPHDSSEGEGAKEEEEAAGRRLITSHGGDSQVETVVFDDADSDDFWA